MYSTCLFCQASLGKNEAIEHFQVGRRLAFDAEKGRLWVVCRKCARWNLTPLEERWEAVEECERAFASTRLRVSTDNVGLARLKEGLELVRIGQPQRPELAAWRYGEQFGRRRRRYLIGSGIVGAAAVANFGMTMFGSSLGLAGAAGLVSAAYGVTSGVSLYNAYRVKGRVIVPGERRLALIRATQMHKVRVVSDGNSWFLRLPLDGGEVTNREKKKDVSISGEAALRAAATILAINNGAGAHQELVVKATDLLTLESDPSRLMLQATRGRWVINQKVNRWTYVDVMPKVDPPGETSLTNMQPEMLLALEMATNEDIERRAMEGELAMLEAAWRQAEEIAAIADNLGEEKPGDISARSES